MSPTKTFYSPLFFMFFEALQWLKLNPTGIVKLNHLTGRKDVLEKAFATALRKKVQITVCATLAGRPGETQDYQIKIVE